MARVIPTKVQTLGKQIPQTERKSAQEYTMKNGKGKYGKSGNGSMMMPRKNGKSKPSMMGNPKKMKKGKM